METTLILILLAIFATMIGYSGRYINQHKRKAEWQRWRKRSAGLSIINSIERVISLLLIAVTIVIIILLIVWGKNQ
jgi:amino acid transporter